MSVAGAKAAFQTLKTELDDIANPWKKLDLYLRLNEFVAAQIGQVRQDVKDAESPSNVSELGSFVVVDDAGRKYTVDLANGNLTEI